MNGKILWNLKWIKVCDLMQTLTVEFNFKNEINNFNNIIKELNSEIQHT